MSSESWSRVRKLAAILVIAGLLTWVMLKLTASTSVVAQACFPAYTTSMVVLAMSYVADSVLRIVAERMPIPFLSNRQIEVK